MNRHDLTLPIAVNGTLRLESKAARALGEELQQAYVSAQPFPHIVLDNFLPNAVLQQALAGFPQAALSSDRVFEINYGGHHKRQILPYDCNASAQSLFAFMNSAPILQFLEGLSGIEGLIADPYFEGGGYHEIGKDGRLGIHADFRVHKQLHVQRRLNLLIYLNPQWDDSWGGRLELWDKSMTECKSSVAPILNRCVVFSTDAESFHGHPDPLTTPDGITRRSLALYYYTASRQIYAEVPAHSTMYYARPHDDTAIQREARQFRFDQYISDWLPPVMARLFFRVQRKVRQLAGQPVD